MCQIAFRSLELNNGLGSFYGWIGKGIFFYVITFKKKWIYRRVNIVVWETTKMVLIAERSSKVTFVMFWCEQAFSKARGWGKKKVKTDKRERYVRVLVEMRLASWAKTYLMPAHSAFAFILTCSWKDAGLVAKVRALEDKGYRRKWELSFIHSCETFFVWLIQFFVCLFLIVTRS